MSERRKGATIRHFIAKELLLATMLLTSQVAAAELHCQSIAGGAPKLETIDAHARLAYLRERLRRGARRARWWHYGWSGTYAALAAYQVVLIPFGDRDARINYYFGAGSSLLGLAVLWIAPLKVMADEKWLERRIAAAPADESVCALLAEAERLLVRDAAAEAFGKSPMVHAGNFVLNIGLALALGLGFHHWDQAAIQGPVGIAVGELQTFTQPTDELKTLAAYRRGELTSRERADALRFTLLPTAGRDHVGIALGFSF
jgi:hypothetical protein